MFRPSNDLQKTAFFTLFIGAIGDWVSTRVGLSLGLSEGNQLAAFLMSRGAWIQFDAFFIFFCFAVPLLVSNFSDEKAPRSLFLFPLMAGLLKLLVSVWNISLILI